MAGIWAIVLAAGESRRMKSPKMLLPFNGRTMIENVIENISGSIVDNIMVVTGAYNDEVTRVAGHTGVTFCYNKDYGEGMLSSVKCAVRSLPGDAGCMLVFPGDKPMITPEVIDLLIDVYIETGKGIVIPVHMKKRGHPVLIDIKYRSEIQNLDPGRGLRSLSEIFPEDVIEVETGNPGILRDIDTYEDYMSSLNQTP